MATKKKTFTEKQVTRLVSKSKQRLMQLRKGFFQMKKGKEYEVKAQLKKRKHWFYDPETGGVRYTFEGVLAASDGMTPETLNQKILELESELEAA